MNGQLQNPGSPLQDYVFIVVTLHYERNNVINFDGFSDYDVEAITGEQRLDFEVCVYPPTKTLPATILWFGVSEQGSNH